MNYARLSISFLLLICLFGSNCEGISVDNFSLIESQFQLIEKWHSRKKEEKRKQKKREKQKWEKRKARRKRHKKHHHKHHRKNESNQVEVLYTGTSTPSNDPPAGKGGASPTPDSVQAVTGSWNLTIIAPDGEQYVQQIDVANSEAGAITLPSKLQNGTYTVILSGDNLAFNTTLSSPQVSYTISLHVDELNTNTSLPTTSGSGDGQIVFDGTHRLYYLYFTVTNA